MFAIIEFEKKECSIVPLTWLVDNQKKCYWPTVSKNDTLQDYIKKEVSPKSWWPKYVIVKLMHTTESHEEAAAFLQRFLEESSSSEENVNLESYSLKDVGVISDEHDVGFKTPLLRKKRSAIRSPSLSSLGQSPGDVSKDGPVPVKKLKHTNEGMNLPSSQANTSISSDEFSDSDCESQSRNSELPSHSNNNIPEISQSPSTSSLASTVTVSSCSNATLTAELPVDIILQRIEHIISVQDQQSIILSNIMRCQQAQNVPNRPESCPKVPVSSKTEFRALETFLDHEENFNYMKSRLASIGGINVRNCVMNTLKYLLTDHVAMKFNWAGRDKRPFKDTNIMKCINDAMRLAFSNRETADFSDQSIKHAVQDWLKLAKHRYLCKKNK